MKSNNILDQPTQAHITFVLVWQSSGQPLLNGTHSAVQQHSTACWSCVPWPLRGCPKEKRAMTKILRKMDIQLVRLLLLLLLFWFCLFVWVFVCLACCVLGVFLSFLKMKTHIFKTERRRKKKEISCIHLLTFKINCIHPLIFSNCCRRVNCYFDQIAGTIDPITGL